MPIDSPHDLRVYSNGKRDGINEVVHYLISIVHKHVYDNESRTLIFKSIVEKYPETRDTLHSFLH